MLEALTSQANQSLGLMASGYINRIVKGALQKIRYTDLLPVWITQIRPRWAFQAVTVFSISVATVIGPTPPGTGVM